MLVMPNTPPRPERIADSRITVLCEHIAAGKLVCPYAAPALRARKIQFSVAPADLSFEAFCAMVEQFYADKMMALVVMAPEGFAIQPGELQRATEMAERMNEMLWMAFAAHAHPGLMKMKILNETRLREFLAEAWRHARYQDIALQPRDEHTAFSIQAMGPFYHDPGHYRYAPGDLFLQLVRMSDVEALQKDEGQKARIEKIRSDANASTKGLVDFMALVVPETLDELPRAKAAVVQWERVMQG
jgi:hypothetical protein